MGESFLHDQWEGNRHQVGNSLQGQMPENSRFLFVSRFRWWPIAGTVASLIQALSPVILRRREDDLLQALGQGDQPGDLRIETAREFRINLTIAPQFRRATIMQH